MDNACDHEPFATRPRTSVTGCLQARKHTVVEGNKLNEVRQLR
jgi:hypothetical protein